MHTQQPWRLVTVMLFLLLATIAFLGQAKPY
jgi:hypothetical protein